MTTVALVGPDGAGKSTLAERLVAELPVPAVRVYMGVNLESSGVLLPTTRLALAVKRRRGGRPDMTARVDGSGRRGALATARSLVRLANWIAEEWFRQGVAWIHERRGRIVVFDRHFLADYHAAHIVRRPGRQLAARLHGLMLDRLYPRPDLVVVLDAPAAVLHARKPEGTLEAADRRRQDYLALADVFDRVEVVDVDRPLDDVAAELTRIVTELAGSRSSSSHRESTTVPPATATLAARTSEPTEVEAGVAR